jgi:hypothetical protein
MINAMETDRGAPNFVRMEQPGKSEVGLWSDGFGAPLFTARRAKYACASVSKHGLAPVLSHRSSNE